MKLTNEEASCLNDILSKIQEPKSREVLSGIIQKITNNGPATLIGRTQLAAELGFSSFLAFRRHLYAAKPDCLYELKREGCIIRSPKPIIKNKPEVKFIDFQGRYFTGKQISDLKYFTGREAEIIRKYYT